MINTTAATDATSSNDLIVAKVISMIVLGATSFAIGVSPIKLTKLFRIHIKDSENNLPISLLLCFGGGVLLFTTFLHLQPEVRDNFAYLEAADLMPTIGKGIPMSELVFCLGFFFVYTIEEVVHVLLDRKSGHQVLHRSLSLRCSKKENVCIPRVGLNKDERENSISCISTSNKELLNSQNNVSFVNATHAHAHIDLDENIKNSFSGLLAVLALSFHAIFEGLAVGLEHSVQKVWYLFAAIATHKLVIAFCVGIELVSSKTKTTLVLVYIGTFAVVTPLGIGAGIALSGTSSTAETNVTSVFLQGMAAGTLLYVVFFEVLARERSNQHCGVWKLVAIAAGFAVMFSLQIATGHEHSHSHGEPAVTKNHVHNHTHFS